MTGDLLTDNDLKTERATEPVKRWFSWWLAKERGVSLCVNGVVYALPSQKPWRVPAAYPSRDAADTEAHEVIDQLRAPFGISKRRFEELALEYLGAFPEGEAP